jgi:polyisoprenyl-phosphate glycosyltransferase
MFRPKSDSIRLVNRNVGGDPIDRCDLSVVIPVYKCRQSLEELTQRILDSVSTRNLSHELIFVDDACPENSWETIEKIASKRCTIRAIKHRRNYGQTAAIATGIGYASGDSIIVIDGDLQDPPELIGELLEFRTGNTEIVIGERTARDHGAFRDLLSLGYQLLSFFPVGLPVMKQYSNYVLLTRRAATEYLKRDERNVLFITLLIRLGLERKDFRYKQEKRPYGESAYSFAKLVNVFFKRAYTCRNLNLSLALSCVFTLIPGTLASFATIAHPAFFIGVFLIILCILEGASMVFRKRILCLKPQVTRELNFG